MPEDQVNKKGSLQLQDRPVSQCVGEGLKGREATTEWNCRRQMEIERSKHPATSPASSLIQSQPSICVMNG